MYSYGKFIFTFYGLTWIPFMFIRVSHASEHSSEFLCFSEFFQLLFEPLMENAWKFEIFREFKWIFVLFGIFFQVLFEPLMENAWKYFEKHGNLLEFPLPWSPIMCIPSCFSFNTCTLFCFVILDRYSAS